MFSEDLSAFFDTDDFAVIATLQSGAEAPVIFDAAYLEQLGIISGTNPVALAKATDVSASNVAQTITINGTAYTIRDRQPVDDGATVLLQLST